MVSSSPAPAPLTDHYQLFATGGQLGYYACNYTLTRQCSVQCPVSGSHVDSGVDNHDAGCGPGGQISCTARVASSPGTAAGHGAE